MPTMEQSRAHAVEARRKKVADGTLKRTLVDPTTCDRDYTPDEVEFMLAMDAYRRANNRPFPTWSEALGVLRSLGYRKDAARKAGERPA